MELVIECTVVNDALMNEMHTDEALVRKPCCLEVEISLEKLSWYTSQGIYQTSAELIHPSRRQYIIHSKIHKLIVFGMRKNCRISGKNLLLHLFIGRMIQLIMAVIEEYQSKLTPCVDEITGHHLRGF
jgi:hypothetical protein